MESAGLVDSTASAASGASADSGASAASGASADSAGSSAGDGAVSASPETSQCPDSRKRKNTESKRSRMMQVYLKAFRRKASQSVCGEIRIKIKSRIRSQT
ncbi:MAG: hypothetical protein EA353_01505 [Puniceicoccaceae bacterium]|nr:MAG: hypothetical protein EA353_01505 [Puniceicoccaceae bacterium]